MENFWAAILIIAVLTWYSMFGVLDRNYKIEQQDVENIVHQYTQIAAKKGILYKAVFDEMTEKLGKYGEYEIYLSAEKFTEVEATPAPEGDSDSQPPQTESQVIKLEGTDIINKDLRSEGYDLINVTVVYEKRHPVSVMYEFTVFGTPKSERHDYHLAGKSSVYIQ